jgi:hypothetical protein
LYVLKSVYNKHQLDSYANELLDDFFKWVINDTSSYLSKSVKNHNMTWDNKAPKFQKCKDECNVVMISLGDFKFDFYYSYSNEFINLIADVLKQKDRN